MQGQTIIPSISNLLRYGDGKRGIADLDLPFSYFENLTDVRLGLHPTLTVGFRLLFDDPPEVGPGFRGVQRRFLEFRRENVRLRAGHLSHLFGYGLALNLFEDRGLAFDTWLDGVHASYRSGFFDVNLIGGRIAYRDSVTITRHENYRVLGGNVELHPFNNLTIGMSALSADGEIPHPVDIRNIEAEILETYVTYSSGRISGSFNWAQKGTRVAGENGTSSGYGMYASLSYSGEGLGFIVDYKSYRFDIRNPFERYDFARPTRFLPFQNAPIVQREHNSTLLSRSIHEVDFNDETGIQIEVFWSLYNKTMLTVNMSLSSRHDLYIFEGTSFTFERVRRRTRDLPVFDDRYSPFTEFFMEIEHRFSFQTSFKGGIGRRTKVIYNEFSGRNHSHYLRTLVAPFLVYFPVSGSLSGTIVSEHEWVHDSFSIAQPRFYNQLLSVTASRSPDLTATVRYEFTTHEADPTGRKNWMAGEVGYTLDQTHTVTISYGSERGGLTCSNGVCRYMQPFVGLRLSILSQF
jgi:hypothetical protein